MSLTDKRPEMTRKHMIKKLEEETLASIALARPVLENNLLKFNKFVLGVEEGKDKVPLAPVHEEMCEFIDKNKKKFKLALIPRGHLKALKTNGTKILTEDGFKNYSEIKVGDKVIGESGKSVKIKAINPISLMDLYKVTTNDGREIVCNEEHLFKVRVCANTKKWKVRNLRWILKRYEKGRLDKRDGKTHYEHAVQLKPIPVYFYERGFSIDPYTLGMWLGDGHSAGSRVTSADPEEFEYSSFRWHKYKTKYLYGTHGLYRLLRLNNLLNNKHIPQEYLLSSYNQRLELLRGLMDTDGTCHCQGGIAYFSNTNYRLIKDIVSLIRSLGGVAVICKVNMQVNGEDYDSWTVSVKLPNNINPFNLKRKAKQFTGLKRELTINIIDIERVEKDFANCIVLDDDNGMFIANDYFPTHNSTTITVGRALQTILADRSKRVLIANATYKNACSFLTDIKRHLKFNDKIKTFWGDPLEDVEIWARDQIMLKKPVGSAKEPTITVMGLEGSLTSQHYDCIILDDLVNQDYVNTADQIEKTINFYKECLNLLEPGGELIVIGTRWHDSDLYGWIMDSDNNIISNFETFIRQAYQGSLDTDEDFKVLFPGKFTRKILLKLYEQQGPYVFSSQYMNDCIPSENATFKKDWFQYYEPADLRGAVLNHFTMVDPAISLERDADYTGVVTVAVDQFQNIYVKNIIRKRMTPDELITNLFKLNEQYHPQEIAVEDVAYQKALQYYLSQEMNRKQIYLPIVQVKPANRSKDQRIKGLQPLYANGKIFHARIVANIQQLEDELLRFPRGKHDDVVDALSYALDIMYAPKRKVTRNHKNKYLYS